MLDKQEIRFSRQVQGKKGELWLLLTVMSELPKFLANKTKSTDNSPNKTDKTLVTIVACTSVIFGLNGFTKSAIDIVARALIRELIVL